MERFATFRGQQEARTLLLGVLVFAAIYGLFRIAAAGELSLPTLPDADTPRVTAVPVAGIEPVAIRIPTLGGPEPADERKNAPPAAAPEPKAAPAPVRVEAAAALEWPAVTPVSIADPLPTVPQAPTAVPERGREPAEAPAPAPVAAPVGQPATQPDAVVPAVTDPLAQEDALPVPVPEAKLPEAPPLELPAVPPLP